jgi:hypothetical protein
MTHSPSSKLLGTKTAINSPTFTPVVGDLYSALKMEAKYFSGTVSSYKFTRSYNPQDYNTFTDVRISNPK